MGVIGLPHSHAFRQKLHYLCIKHETFVIIYEKRIFLQQIIPSEKEDQHHGIHQ